MKRKVQYYHNKYMLDTLPVFFQAIQIAFLVGFECKLFKIIINIIPKLFLQPITGKE